MYNLMSHTLVLVIVLPICLFVAPAQSKNVVCYYANWAQYRPQPGTYTVSNIDPFGCTHVIYAFAKLDGSAVVGFEPNDDQPPWMWRQFTQLKKTNPKLKTLLALGGYSHGTRSFSTLAANPEGRQQFIRSVITLLRFWDFDGLDLDWEYPGDFSPLDKDNYSFLVKEIWEAFVREAATSSRERLLLAAAVPAGIARVQKGYDIPELDKYLDLYNVMGYDYHGQWESVTGLASPLSAIPGDSLNVVSTINYYIQQGATKSKIMLGMGLYGRSWTLSRSGDTEVGSPTIAGGAPGTFTREAGVLSAYEVCSLLTNGYTERFDPVGQVMYAFQGNQWITYENETTLNMKVDWILAEDLGGAMIWSLDLDDFTGLYCRRGSYPLLKIVSSRLINIPDTETTTGATSVVTTTASATTAAATTTAPVTTTAPATTAAATTTNPATATVGAASTTLGSRQVFKCPQVYGMFPDSTRCNMYYYCRSNMPFLIPCSDGKMYDPATKGCSSTYVCPIK